LIDLLVNAPDAAASGNASGAASGAAGVGGAASGNAGDADDDACLDDTPLVIILLLSSYFNIINTIVNFKKLKVK